MTLLLILILALIQFSLYHYLKNSTNQLRFMNYKRPVESIRQQEMSTVCTPKPKEVSIQNVVTSDDEERNHMLLNKRLRHLEFISEFEMYLDDKNYKNFSIAFLQELKNIKIEAQLSACKATTMLSEHTKIAA